MKTVSNTTEEKAVQVAQVTIPVELLNQVLQYLSTKPYSEVAGVISAIHSNSKTI